MKWDKPSDEVASFLEETLAPFNCQARKLFGCPVHFVNGNMMAGVHEENIFLRLDTDDREQLKAENDEVSHFAPGDGRPMREYVVLPESICNNTAEFEKWLDRSHRFVSSLPVKEPKKQQKSRK